MCNCLHRLILGLGIAIGVLFSSGGCSFHRTPCGWTLSSGWNLEFSRLKRCSAAGCSSSGDCDAVDASKTSYKADTCGDAVSADEVICKGENPVWMRLLQRRGRLCICSNCKQLVHANKSPSSPSSGSDSAPKAANAPIIPKLFPVPTQPAFTPREVQVEGAKFKPVPGGRGLDRHSPPLSIPEEIPAPPAFLKGEKSARSTEKPEDSQGQSSWVFSRPPDQKPDPVIEPPLPSESYNSTTPNNRAAQNSTRR
jgi:hypothetical protein